MEQPEYSQKDGEVLVCLARQSIGERLGIEMEDTCREMIEKAAGASRFQEERATFVTLKKEGTLRGCIGNLVPVGTIWDSIRRNACQAAFHDPRFPAVTAVEFDSLAIEISILSRPRPLAHKGGWDLCERLRPGRDGVILRLGGAQATFLPQVWEQLPRVEDFLAHLCLKAGLAADAFLTSDVEIKTYEVWHYP